MVEFEYLHQIPVRVSKRNDLCEAVVVRSIYFNAGIALTPLINISRPLELRLRESQRR